MSELPELVKDPICGMMVDPTTAAAFVERGGQTHYFCSEECAEEFSGDSSGHIDHAM